MTAVDSVLVVGAGVGSAVAILLAEAGVAVEMVEAGWKDAALGSGIMLFRNALRVLRRLGVWEETRGRLRVRHRGAARPRLAGHDRHGNARQSHRRLRPAGVARHASS